MIHLELLCSRLGLCPGETSDNFDRPGGRSITLRNVSSRLLQDGPAASADRAGHPNWQRSPHYS